MDNKIYSIWSMEPEPPLYISGLAPAYSRGNYVVYNSLWLTPGTHTAAVAEHGVAGGRIDPVE